MAQADGSYPRLNAALLQSNKFQGMIVSFIGKIRKQDLANQQIEFECSDGGVIQLDCSQAELPEGMDLQAAEAPVMEAIGQVDENNCVSLFITRELSSDTNMDVYNKMLQVQHNPKFASYFAPLTGDAAMGQ